MSKEVLRAMSDGLKILLGALGGAIVILLFVSVLGGGGMMGTMGQMMSGSMMGGGLFGMLFCAALLGGGHSPDRRTGGLDRQPDPAAPLGPQRLTPCRHRRWSRC